MILDEIALLNFGLYAGRQTMVLTPPTASKPVILIGGLNGGGKTTLLDALQLCLYGAHARTSNRGSVAYAEYLSRCIHRGAGSSEAAIEIAFRHTVEGKEDHYRLRRSWRLNGSGCKERFDVLKNGRQEPALAENWITQVEDLLPPNIAHLFFFDGEQIESYASLTNSSALIGAAIQNLLGLDVVDQLDKDLQIFERRKRTQEKDDVSRAEVEAIENELCVLRARSEKLAEERAALRTHKIDQQRKALAKLEEQFRKLGGELYERRTEIERQRDHATEEAAKCADNLRELSAGTVPLLIVRGLLKKVAGRDHAEAAGRQARDIAKALKERDKAVLTHLRKKKLPKNALEAIGKFLDQDRYKRSAAGGTPALLDLSADSRSDLLALMRDGLANVSKEAAVMAKNQVEAEARAERLGHQFDSIPGADTIAEIATRRDALRVEIAELESDYATLGAEIDRVFREIERKGQNLTRLLEDGAKAEGERQDRTRILHHSSKVRETLSAFRRAVTQRHVRRIEQLVFESYKQLLRKATLVTRLTIDAETYSLSLYGRDDKILSSETLSAGERQLLAIALLWGLAKASGRPLPTAIDTPLGRLDAEHRTHLVERYFPFASHQVLLLSTDEEIAGDYLRRLEPWIGRRYHLAYDDKLGQTRIVPGYFEERAAAA
jgi:DNA sulfur modification protein DndD